MCTDGTYVCSLCLGPKTRCFLCIEAPMIPTPPELKAKLDKEDREWNESLNQFPSWVYYH